MSTLTVAELKEKLEEYLDVLEQYDDDCEIETENNTYYIKSHYYMQFGSTGFVDLGNLEDNITYPDDDDETDDSEEQNTDDK